MLWILDELNNIDKHRIILTVGSALNSVGLGAYISNDISKFAEQIPGFGGVPDFQLFVKPADRLFPLKAGDELFIDAPDAEVNEKMPFAFDVAFGEPQILEGEPLVETLQKFADIADNLIRNFEPVL